jgi:hypothetical protein
MSNLTISVPADVLKHSKIWSTGLVLNVVAPALIALWEEFFLVTRTSGRIKIGFSSHQWAIQIRLVQGCLETR